MLMQNEKLLQSDYQVQFRFAVMIVIWWIARTLSRYEEHKPKPS